MNFKKKLFFNGFLKRLNGLKIRPGGYLSSYLYSTCNNFNAQLGILFVNKSV